jgi:hypothetical protein
VLAWLAPVTATGLLPRLVERLGERLSLFEVAAATVTVAVPAAMTTALTGASTGDEPGLHQTRLARFGQWWEEHNLTRAVLVSMAGLIVLVIAAAIVVFQPSRPRTTDVVEVLGLRPPGGGSEDSAIGRASTPTTGRLPEIAITEAPIRPVETPEDEAELTPRLTATPQNRAPSGPVVILNPLSAGQTNLPLASSAAGVQEPPVSTATPTATAIPTPPPPRLVVSAQSLHFSGNETTKTVTLRNSGSGQVRWDVVSQQAWLIASPGGGVIGNGPTTLQVQVDRTLGGAGRRQGTLTLNSTSGVLVINVTVE